MIWTTATAPTVITLKKRAAFCAHGPTSEPRTSWYCTRKNSHWSIWENPSNSFLASKSEIKTHQTCFLNPFTDLHSVCRSIALENHWIQKPLNFINNANTINSAPSSSNLQGMYVHQVSLYYGLQDLQELIAKICESSKHNKTYTRIRRTNLYHMCAEINSFSLLASAILHIQTCQ